MHPNNIWTVQKCWEMQALQYLCGGQACGTLLLLTDGEEWCDYLAEVVTKISS